MRMTVKTTGTFAVEDIRRLRDNFDRRYTDDKGNIDWDGATAEIERGAASIRAEIARIRTERGLPAR